MKVKRIGGLYDKKNKKHQAGSVYSINGIAPYLVTNGGGYHEPMIEEIDKPVNKRLIDTINDNGLDEDVSYIDAYNRKVEKNGTTGTITARINDNNKFISKNLRIRKLTPKECIRLMGFSDQDYMAMAQVNSDSQIYKQAGNSIVVNVLEAIFKEML